MRAQCLTVCVCANISNSLFATCASAAVGGGGGAEAAGCRARTAGATKPSRQGARRGWVARERRGAEADGIGSTGGGWSDEKKGRLGAPRLVHNSLTSPSHDSVRCDLSLCAQRQWALWEACISCERPRFALGGQATSWCVRPGACAWGRDLDVWLACSARTPIPTQGARAAWDALLAYGLYCFRTVCALAGAAHAGLLEVVCLRRTICLSQADRPVPTKRLLMHIPLFPPYICLCASLCCACSCRDCARGGSAGQAAGGGGKAGAAGAGTEAGG